MTRSDRISSSGTGVGDLLITDGRTGASGPFFVKGTKMEHCRGGPSSRGPVVSNSHTVGAGFLPASVRPAPRVRGTEVRERDFGGTMVWCREYSAPERIRVPS